MMRKDQKVIGKKIPLLQRSPHFSSLTPFSLTINQWCGCPLETKLTIYLGSPRPGLSKDYSPNTSCSSSGMLVGSVLFLTLEGSKMGQNNTLIKLILKPASKAKNSFYILFPFPNYPSHIVQCSLSKVWQRNKITT